MIKKFTQFFAGLREISDNDKSLKWIISIALFFVFTIAFSYMKILFGALFLIYALLVFCIFLFGEITIVKETDEYTKKEYDFFGLIITAKIKK